MKRMAVAQSIQRKLQDALSPVSLVIRDDSHKHAGHAAMQGRPTAESHFVVEIVSQSFEGLGLVARHRKVYEILSEEFANGLHALSLKTKTPKETEPHKS